jgi:hypothetical protein
MSGWFGKLTPFQFTTCQNLFEIFCAIDAILPSSGKLTRYATAIFSS